MLESVKKGERQKVIDYIGNDYYKCLYLFLDFLEYGFDNENVVLYKKEENNKINLLILTYYTGMHIFSKNNNYNINDICEFINIKKPRMVCSERKIMEDIQLNIKDSSYKFEYGWVKKCNKLVDDNFDGIEIPREADFDEITSLLITDKGLGASYSHEKLKNQLLSSFLSKYTRNYILKQDGKIIAHVCTGAECDKFAILTDLIVDKNYRHQGIGYKMCIYLTNELIKEGKDVFLVNYTETSSRLYEKVGFKVCCEWAKMYKENGVK